MLRYVMAAGTLQIVYGRSPFLLVRAAAASLGAAMHPLLNAHSQSIWQSHTPRELQGRVLNPRSYCMDDPARFDTKHPLSARCKEMLVCSPCAGREGMPMKNTVLVAAVAALICGSGVAVAANIAKISPADTGFVHQVRRGSGGGHFHGGGFRFHGGPRFYGGGYVYPYYYDYGPRCWWSRRYHRWVCPYYY